jgi:hypothetical protein
MPEPTDRRDEDDRREREERKERAPRQRRRREPAPDRDRRRRRREKEFDDPRAHALILERRWVGSPPPTAALYARALQQWHALGGAIVSPATSVTPAASPRATVSATGHAEATGGDS